MSAPEYIDRATLVTWRGTDAELARTLGVTRSAVCQARIRHEVPRPTRKPLSKTVKRAIVSEANRRGTTIAIVLRDLGVWMDGAE